MYTDLESSNAFFSMFLPFIDFISLVALALWFVALFYKNGITQTTESQNGDDYGHVAELGIDWVRYVCLLSGTSRTGFV